MSRTKVGHYDIVAELGRGGMGVVFKGYEASLNRHVAIKMLSESLAGDTQVVERFFREARSMAQLNDPHIVQIYFVGEDQGQPYFAMEFVEGESLSQRLKRDVSLQPMEAARILLQVAQGLSTAHDRGVIHRDIKPANLLITQRGVVKVADFGIALASQDYNKKLTGTGQFVGTPGYLSPEVCLGKPVDQRSDIFALGIVFFEMLTGRTPFKDESPLGMMLEVVQAEIPDVREINQSVDSRLSDILRRMVAKDPADRYTSCAELIADLVACGVNAASPVTPARPAMAPLAGTAVNAPTPPEMRKLSAASIAPPPAPPTAAAAGSRQAHVGDAVASAPATRRSALPWAAALAGLAIAGGAGAYYTNAFSLRDRIDGITAAEPAAVVAPTTDAAPSAKVAATAVATTSSAEPVPAAAPDAPAPTSAESAVAPTSAEPMAGAMDTTHVKTATMVSPPERTSAAATPAASQPPPAAVATRLAEAPEPPQPAEVPVAETRDEKAFPRLAARQGERLARRAELADKTAVRIARSTPAETPTQSPAASYAGPPRVLVLSFGDPAVAGAAELSIEERIGETQVVLVDEDLAGLSGIEDGSLDVARLVNAASRVADFVVVVKATPLGSQPLTFYGEVMTQYTARIELSTYNVRNRSKLGGHQAQVSFTHLNADPQTREAVAPYLGRIAEVIAGRRARS